MSRYPGRILSSTAPTVNANTAKGIWTLDEALRYSRAGQWPVPTGNGDPYFQYNTMLLPGQGTNGAQNNTFLDSSTNNFTITRNGNTTQGTFTPFSGANGNWSNFFDGSGDYFTSSTSLFNYTTGNASNETFTIEAYIYHNARSTPSAVQYAQSIAAKGDVYLNFGINGTGNLIFYHYDGSTRSFTGSSVIPLNQWTHVAVRVTGGTATLYVNGVSDGSGTWYGIQAAGLTATSYFGTPALNASALAFNGFTSNLRISNNARTITVPTAPYSNDANTVFLTSQSNRFIDNSSNAYAITPVGGVAVTPFQPFGAPTTAYSASTIGGSGYFDGSGDYLTIANNNAFAFGTGNFTVECWVYPISYTGGSADVILSTYQNGTVGWTIAIGTGGGVFYCAAAGDTQVIASSVAPSQQWFHLAMVRSGTTLAFFVNGVRAGTLTDSTNITSTTELSIGTNTGGGALNFIGYMSGARIVKGTAVYDPTQTTLTIPTAPLTAITNTSALLNYTNAGIIDNAQKNDLETVGGAQISTTQYKWGASSMYFDGTGDYLTAPAQQNIAFGTGDFTIECWIYFNSVGNAQIASGSSGATTNAFYWQYFSSQLQFGAQGSAAITAASWTPSANTWYHVAVVRTASTIKQYVNGNLLSSASSSQSFVDAVLFVGFGGAGTLNGYVQDLRISKGLCRYPYNFTAPTAAFPLFYQAAATPSADPYFENTTLLLPGNGTNGAQNNTFLDSSTNAFTITRNGNTTQGTFTPFSQTGWGNFFDGSGDMLSVANNTAFNLSGVDFTVEAWVYRTGDSGAYGEWIVGKRDQANPYPVSWVLLVGTGNKFVFGNNNAPTDVISKTTAELNTWYHVAVVRTGTTASMYINGVLETTVSGHTITEVNTPLTIGNYPIDNPTFTGYISNLRVVKGTAVYSGSSFTVPTSALTAVANTSLLTCQSNRFVDNSTNAFAITRSGDTSVQAFSPFNPTAAYSTSTVGGSGYFDGSGDYLTATLTGQTFGTGNLTAEGWFYINAHKDYNSLMAQRATANSTAGWVVGVNASGQIYLYSGSFLIGPTGSIPTNSWFHVAFVRSSGTMTLYLNGVSVGTSTTSRTFSDTNTGIGGDGTDSNPLNGYASGVRYCQSAVYTTTFTPPTAPPTNIANTVYLVNFTNGGIIDNTAKNNLETVGGASISTTVSKFGGSSMYFDGSGDWLLMPAGDKFAFGTGDYTVEAWVYFTSITTTDLQIIFLSGSTGGNNFYFHVDGNQISVGTSAAFISNQATSFSTATWYHVAACRYSGTLRLFVNGVQIGSSVSDTTNWISAGSARIGANESGTQTVFGYINDHRVTKGIARYTTNFTPPTTAFLTL